MGDHEAEVSKTEPLPDRFIGWLSALFPGWSGDFIVALVRTVVPTFIGTVIASGILRFPDVAEWLDTVYPGWQIAVGAAIVTATVGAYYSLARWVQKRYPRLGAWLLGSNKAPVYIPPTAE